ncbi:unnamed protein product, partial [Discosporangium mesarthrocarpum]
MEGGVGLILGFCGAPFTGSAASYPTASLAKMKLAAAYLLCVLGGTASPAAADVTKVLESVGAEADVEMLEKLMKDMEGKDANEVVAAG